MFVTLISFILALGVLFYSQLFPIEIPFPFLAGLIALAGTVVLLAASLMNVLILNPVQQAERKLLSRLGELFRKDKTLNLVNILLFLFPLLSYLFAIFLLGNFPYKMILVAIWMVSLGLTLDLIRDYARRAMHFLTPAYSIEEINKEAKKAIQTDHDDDLWDWIDGLTEISVRAIQESQLSIAFQALNTFPTLMHTFYTSRKSIAHIAQDQETKRNGLDEASYTSFYILQRLEMINDKALENNLQMVATHIITVLGKIIYYSAQYDMSMVTFPAVYIGRLATLAQQREFNEVAEITNSTLLEVSRTILTELDLTYMELQAPFQAITNDLSTIARGTFKKDKTVNIKIISQPLRDLKALFQTDKMGAHPDTPAILQMIDNSIAEFDALDQIMRTIPPLNKTPEAEAPLPPPSSIEENQRAEDL